MDESNRNVVHVDPSVGRSHQQRHQRGRPRRPRWVNRVRGGLCMGETRRAVELLVLDTQGKVDTRKISWWMERAWDLVVGALRCLCVACVCHHGMPMMGGFRAGTQRA